MESNTHSLTTPEWHLMECLWKHSPRTGRETAEYMKQAVGWSRSTTLTMLRRMTDKKLIQCTETDGMNSYLPLIQRESAVLRETRDFLDRVYQGSISMMLSAIAKKQTLSQEEIDELYAILHQAEEANSHE